LKFEEFLQRLKDHPDYSLDAQYKKMLKDVPPELKKHIVKCPSCEKEVRKFVTNTMTGSYSMTVALVKHAGFDNEPKN